MKSSTFLVATAAALVRAQTPGDDVPINCAKPNANYCMASDIILRCDGDAIGYPARCSPNLSGYPPSGGIASCWQSGEEAGDAACEKNCVVYPEPPHAAFTLAKDECTPSHIPTHPFPNTTITTTITIPTTHCEHECTETHPSSPLPPPVSWPTPIPTTNGTWPVPTETHPPPPPPPPGSTDDGEQPPPEPTEPEEPTNVPIPPTTTGIEPIPTGAAAANKVSVLLAAAGFAAAYLL